MRKQKFRQLVIWQRAMSLVADVYQETAALPREELYGLTGQIRRAAVSIAMNIAEGSGAGSDAEFKRFLQMAMRSAYEVMCGTEVATKLRYLPDEKAEPLLDDLEQLSAMLHVFIKKLRASS
jgi:four helix bundle protein